MRLPRPSASRARWQAIRAEREDCDAHGPAARLAPDGAATCSSTASPSPARLFDFALYFFHNASALIGAETGPYFYLPEDGEPPRSAALERRVQPRPGRARRPARHHQGDRADRDDGRRVRDGRDPLRAARAFGRAQHRALGLHFHLHQEIPPQPGFLPGRPRAGDDDRAVHARLRAAAGQDLPRAATRLRWAAWRRRSRSRTIRAANEAALEKVRAGQAARGDRRLRRHAGWRIRASFRSRRRCSTSTCPAEPDSTRSAPTSTSRRQGPAGFPAGGADHRGRAAQQHQHRHPVPRRVARGQRLRARCST